VFSNQHLVEKVDRNFESAHLSPLVLATHVREQECVRAFFRALFYNPKPVVVALTVIPPVKKKQMSGKEFILESLLSM
jgi:hypothetical protein